jgi:hypothetical protein
MQDFKSLQKLGLQPVTKQVSALSPGDVIPVFDGKHLRPQEVFGVPKQRGSVVEFQSRQIRNITKKGTGRYGATQQIPVFEQDDVNQVYEDLVLSVLKPGVPSLPPKQIYRILREQTNQAVGYQRVKMAITRLVDRHVLLETDAYWGNGIPQVGYRQFLTTCQLPLVVYERRNHRVGWVVRLDERPPVQTRYPVVHWFDGAIQISNERFLEPVDEKACRGVEMAIRYRLGDVPEGFVEVPSELIRAIRSQTNITNRLVIAAIGAYLEKEGVELPRVINQFQAPTLADRVLCWLNQYYPGWLYGIAAQDLIAEPPAGAI